MSDPESLPFACETNVVNGSKFDSLLSVLEDVRFWHEKQTRMKCRMLFSLHFRIGLIPSLKR